MNDWTPPAPPAVAIELGHAPEWDPPAASSSVWRWTCPCGMAVLDRNFNVYGSAAEQRCPREAQR